MPSRVLAIAGKELRENILSRRFQIALALATLLMVSSVVVLAVNYRQDLESFNASQADLQQGQQVGGFNTVSLEVAKVLKRPNALSIFVGGPADSYRRNADLTSEGVHLGGMGPQASGGSASPTSHRFAPLDLAFVAVVLMTFMAVLFAYDAVSGERERGTLKLMLANPVPRDTILVGKYLGGMASVLLPFAASAAAALAVFQFLGISLSADDWLRLALILLLYVPLVSAFYLLGLLVSSLTRRSGTSLLALLLAWLLLAFGTGNVAAAASTSLHDGAGDADLMRQFQAIRDEQQSRSAEVHDRLEALHQSMANQNDTKPLLDELAAIAKEAEAQRDAAVTAARQRLDGQLRLAEALALLSPAEAYKSLATALAQSDYWSYVRQRDAAILYLHEVERARQDWNADRTPGGGTFFVDVRGTGLVSRVQWSGGAGEDFEPPAFPYQPPALAAQMGSPQALQALGVLLASNALAFAGAYIAFRRYDVR